MAVVQRPGRVVFVHREDETGVAGFLVAQHLHTDVAALAVLCRDQSFHLCDRSLRVSPKVNLRSTKAVASPGTALMLEVTTVISVTVILPLPRKGSSPNSGSMSRMPSMMGNSL